MIFKLRITSKKLWIGIGVLLSLFWFLFNLQLPDLYKGRRCCDSVGYIGIADALSPEKFFSSKDAYGISDERTLGYPLFLYVHKQIFSSLGLKQLDWVNFALFSGWMIYLLSILFFIKSLRRKGMKVHPGIFLLLLAHPALIADSAVPLSDVYSLSWVLLALGGYIRSTVHCNEGVRTLSYRWILVSGLSFGMAIFIRMPYLPPVAIFLTLAVLINSTVAWRAGKRVEVRSVFLKHCLIGFMIFLVSLPGLIHYTKKYGELCVLEPKAQKSNVKIMLNNGFTSPRLYVAFAPTTHCFVLRDPWLRDHFKDCWIYPQDNILPKLLQCYGTRPLSSVFAFIKKTAGLYDGFQLNTYAAEITHCKTLVVYRIFGALGFAGFFCGLFSLPFLAFRKRVPVEALPVLLFPLFIILFQFMFHVESRYGFSAIPGAFVMLFISGSEIPQMGPRYKKIFWSVFAFACFYFIWQTAFWDRLDALAY